MAAFDLSTRHDGATSIISIQGDLDMDSAPVLVAAASTELASPDCNRVILDAAGLEFLDSTGLAGWIDQVTTVSRDGPERGESG